MREKVINTNQQLAINKLRAHAEHLLDGFITLRERYAMLRPMLHNESVVKNKGSNKQYRGFIIIRNTMLLSCCQLIANLCFDKNSNCPSIHQLMEKLEDTSLRKIVKDVYSRPTPIASSDLSDEVLKFIQQDEHTSRKAEFDKFYKELLLLWSQFKTSKSATSILEIRKKVAAHTDINLIDGQYRLFDISSLDLKWDDILETISNMQEIIESLNIIIRNSSYSWDTLDELIYKSVNDYWEIPSQPN